MPDINDYFDSFPDYDVFTGKTTPPNKRRVGKRRTPMPQPERSYPPPQPKSDYGDGYGTYKERKVKKHKNYLTVFFFPLAIGWLEFFMKFATGVEFNFVSAIYTFLFIMPIACILTLICTFGSIRVNRVLCNIFMFLITAIFEAQLIYFGKYRTLFTFSGNKYGGLSFSDITSSFANNLVWFIILLVPFLFSLILGGRVFGFEKIRVLAKISLVLVAVLFQILAVTAVSFSKNSKNPIASYKLYNTTFNAPPSQERFGLLETEYLDIKNALT